MADDITTIADTKNIPDAAQPVEKPGDKPVEFSKSETIPLGFTNKLLRKAAYGFGLASFIATGFSGVKNQNYLRIAASFGSAGINAVSLISKEQDNPLPEGSVTSQAAHSLLHPQSNALFFNRSATFITDMLTLMSGFDNLRSVKGSASTINALKTALDTKGPARSALFEIGRGAWAVSGKAIDIAGLSSQDKRERRATQAALEGKEVVDDRTMAEKIFANRWVSIASMAGRAGLQVAQGLEKAHGVTKDTHMLNGGIFYCLATLSLLVDNIIIELNIKKEANAAQSR